MANTPRVAIIDRDPVFSKKLLDRLELEGCQVRGSSDSSQATSLVACFQPDVVIIDLGRGADRRAWHVLDSLKHAPETREVPVIVCNYGGAALHKQVPTFRQYGVKLLPKPRHIRDVVRATMVVVRTGLGGVRKPWQRR